MFDWRDNLDQAEALRDSAAGSPIRLTGSEAALCAVVGRAYYAAFGHARHYAVRHLGFLTTGTASDHGRLVPDFRASRRRRVAGRLHLPRHWRNQCDYDDTVPTLQTIVQDALREAAAVIRQLRAGLAEAPQVGGGMLEDD